MLRGKELLVPRPSQRPGLEFAGPFRFTEPVKAHGQEAQVPGKILILLALEVSLKDLDRLAEAPRPKVRDA